MTVNDVISQVRSGNRQLFDDNMISDRYIYNSAVNTAVLLIGREIKLRRLTNSDNVFTPIECLKMKLVDYTECGISCDGKVRRSVDKVPELQEGIYSYIIQGVYNINNSAEIHPTTVREHINLLKLKQKGDKAYYIIKNQYLYILDKFIENVNLYVYIADQVPFTGLCESAYDAKFSLPGYLKDSFFQILDKEILKNITKPKDTTDNNNDENQ